MNILVITRSSWSDDNNIGNTMSNIFRSFPKDANIYNLYFRADSPKNKICKSAYQINEVSLIKGILKRTPPGRELSKQEIIVDNTSESLNERKMYTSAKKYNLSILWFIRELIWSLGNWKNSTLLKYVEKIQPDIIFMPVFGCYYPHKVLNYINKHSKAKIILFHADDNYTLRQFSLSPFYWIYRFGLRKWVKRSVDISESNYVISDIQKQEYEKCFKRKCEILTKGGDFSNELPLKVESNAPLKLVFTGNISSGRWKSLAKIGEALSKINEKTIKAQLYIYSLTPMTKTMSKALDYPNSIFLMGGVSADRISTIQSDADILVHVESTQLKERLLVHQSFSTKIVDYFAAARCILAVGPTDVASIDYLLKKDAAIVSSNQEEIENNLRMLIDNPRMLKEYGEKAWNCGKNNHQIDLIQSKLYKDFNTLAKGKKNESITH